MAASARLGCWGVGLGGQVCSCCPYIERGSGSAAPSQADSGMAFTDCWLQAGTTPALMSAACLPLQGCPRCCRCCVAPAPPSSARSASRPSLSLRSVEGGCWGYHPSHLTLPPFPILAENVFVLFVCFVFSFPKIACAVMTDVLYRLVRSGVATV